MSETRKLVAILASDVVGYSRLAGADEDRILARLRALRSDLIDPTIAVHHGRIVKRTGDGSIVEFRSVVDAVRCAIEVQNAMVERNAGVPEDRRIVFRIGIHLGDVVEESDGDLMGDGVNIAARLEGVAAPGTICLSDDAYRQVKGRLDLAVTDLGPTQLKNIAEPIRAYSLQVGVPAVAKPVTETKPPEPKRRLMLPALVVGIGALAVIAGWTWYFIAGRPVSPTVAAHLSIVVLPFANLSNDPAQDYFADGVTENLTTEISRIRDSFVIARNTAFTFKGKSVNAKEIGKELGVRYVLEGSVQRDQNRVRVNAQLIDAQLGAHLWADRFEEDVADLFKLQDLVVARLANKLGYELVKAEAEKSAHSTNPDVIDMTMRGWEILNRPTAKQGPYADAVKLFNEALKLDSRNSEAIVGMAYANLRESMYFGINGTPPQVAAESLNEVTRAIEINPDYAFTYYYKSLALFMMSRFAEALAAAQEGVRVNSNFAFGYVGMGEAEWVLGQCEQAIANLDQAFKLSPRDPQAGSWFLNLGNANLCLDRNEVAVKYYKNAIDFGYRNHLPYIYMAGAYMRLGNSAEAKAALGEARRINPAFTSVKWAMTHLPNYPPLLDALRKAGLPED